MADDVGRQGGNRIWQRLAITISWSQQVRSLDLHPRRAVLVLRRLLPAEVPVAAPGPASQSWSSSGRVMGTTGGESALNRSLGVDGPNVGAGSRSAASSARAAGRPAANFWGSCRNARISPRTVLTRAPPSVSREGNAERRPCSGPSGRGRPGRGTSRRPGPYRAADGKTVLRP